VTRKFEDKPAVRERVPLLVGLVGASGSGKTYSALRLATGIQRVVGGDIGVIDTEARRALHYADTFKFRHLEFGAPFGPLDYLAAIEHMAGKVKTLIIDSMSHEHEGPGGVLEMHEQELDRIAGTDWAKREKNNFTAWVKPKQQRRQLINRLLQLDLNIVFCFRAKEKLKIKQGEKPKALGWMPIAGEEFVYEMTANCLLYPGSGGVPTWHPEEFGERQMIKLPAQFKSVFTREQPLSEDIGEALAKWAEGGPGDSEKATALADIQAELKRRHPNRDKDSQERKVALLGVAFGAKRWADVEDMPLDRLREGLATLRGDSQEREPGSDDDNDLFAAERAAAG
jgi:hypothetical protein